VRIGRLATSLSVRGQGLGELLLQNAIKRALHARNTLGVHAALVEAKTPQPKGSIVSMVSGCAFRRVDSYICRLEPRSWLPNGKRLARELHDSPIALWKQLPPLSTGHRRSQNTRREAAARGLR